MWNRPDSFKMLSTPFWQTTQTLAQSQTTRLSTPILNPKPFWQTTQSLAQSHTMRLSTPISANFHAAERGPRSQTVLRRFVTKSYLSVKHVWILSADSPTGVGRGSLLRCLGSVKTLWRGRGTHLGTRSICLGGLMWSGTGQGPNWSTPMRCRQCWREQCSQTR